MFQCSGQIVHISCGAWLFYIIAWSVVTLHSSAILSGHAQSELRLVAILISSTLNPIFAADYTKRRTKGYHTLQSKTFL